MELGHLGDVDFDGFGHDLREIELREGRDVKTFKRLGLAVLLGVQAAFKFDHGDGRVLNKLNLADPAAVLVLAKLLVNLVQKQVPSVERIGRERGRSGKRPPGRISTTLGVVALSAWR